MTNTVATNLPFISILLAVRNEAEHLDQCLRSITVLDYPANKLEIIVVDGVSSDNTLEIARNWSKKDERIRCISNPKQIVSSGINLGLKIAKGDFILWTSGHVLLQQDHLIRCWNTMNETSAAAVGGMINTQGTTAIGRINALVLSNRFGVGGGEHRVGGTRGWVPAVTMALYRKQAVLDAGGFDEKLPRNQDNDLHERMNGLGLRSYFDPEIRPVYLCRNTLSGLLRQAWKNGYWNMMLQRMGKGGLQMRHYVPLLFVSSLIVSGIGAVFSTYLLILLAMIVGVYLVTAFVVSVSLGVRNRRVLMIPVFIFWFAALHFSYGISSLWGLVNRRAIT